MLFSEASLLTTGESFKFFVFLTLSVFGKTSSFGVSSLTISSTVSCTSSTVSDLSLLDSFALPSSSRSEAPTSTVSPSSTRRDVTVPLNGEGTSVSTLSVEISRIGSSSFTSSPTFTSHLRIVPSVTVSPS